MSEYARLASIMSQAYVGQSSCVGSCLEQLVDGVHMPVRAGRMEGQIPVLQPIRKLQYATRHGRVASQSLLLGDSRAAPPYAVSSINIGSCLEQHSNGFYMPVLASEMERGRTIGLQCTMSNSPSYRRQ